MKSVGAFFADKIRLIGWCTVLLVGVLIAWTLVESRLEKAALQRQIRELKERIARLISEESRARLLVESMRQGKDGGLETTLIWADTDADGRMLKGTGLRRFTVKGTDVHCDTRQILFPAESVAEGDPLRGRSLTLFARIYGEREAPIEGDELDLAADADGVPRRFRSADPSARDAESTLWKRWAEYLVNPEACREDGVRTVQGTAVHKAVVVGREYRLKVSALGQVVFEGPFEPDLFVFRPAR
jgi:hypothetical protein